MNPCKNCHWQLARATVDLCVPCWRYERRTGRPRPLKVVLAHLNRTVERQVTTHR